MSERERTWTLFAWVLSWTAFLYWEMGHRQAAVERREESRRNYVDGKLSGLSERLGKAEAKAEGAREAADNRWKPWERRSVVITAIVGVASVVVYLVAYHII